MAARYRQISGDCDRCAAWTQTAACEAPKAVDLVCEETRRAALTESVFRWRSRHLINHDCVHRKASPLQLEPQFLNRPERRYDIRLIRWCNRDEDACYREIGRREFDSKLV